MRILLLAFTSSLTLLACAGSFYSEPIVSDISDSRVIIQLPRGCSAKTDNLASQKDVERVARNACGIYGHNAHPISYRCSHSEYGCCQRIAYLFACSSEEVDTTRFEKRKKGETDNSRKSDETTGESDVPDDPFGLLFVITILLGVLSV